MGESEREVECLEAEQERNKTKTMTTKSLSPSLPCSQSTIALLSHSAYFTSSRELLKPQLADFENPLPYSGNLFPALTIARQ